MSAASRTLTRIADLVAAGLVPADAAPELERVVARYALALTPAMASVIDPSASHDPIARQFVPQREELTASPEERADPIGDHAHSPLEGLVHRYPDRVLIKIIHSCPVYCRYCFRRAMVGPKGDGALSAAAFEAACAYIEARPEIFEAILTGGDPLMLSARRIGAVTRRLATIAHLGVLRWHSRVPIVSPERITPALVTALRHAEKAVWLIIHVNHARELTLEAKAAIGRIVDAGIPVLSQSVLLRGVNDDANTLEALFRALVAIRVKPYYLHHPDLAEGTGHFRLPIADGQALVGALRGAVSGLCQPTYMLDIPGGYGKVPIGLCHVRRQDGAALVIDPTGRVHSLVEG